MKHGSGVEIETINEIDVIMIVISALCIRACIIGMDQVLRLKQ